MGQIPGVPGLNLMEREVGCTALPLISDTFEERHFAPDTARALDAHIEGAALHIALEPDPQSATQTREAITRLIGPSDEQGGPRDEDR